MALLERVGELKKEGMSESQIVSTLIQEGSSPKEISDAISQIQIKSAVGSESVSNEDLKPSIMEQKQQTTAAVAQNTFGPQTFQQQVQSQQNEGYQYQTQEAPQPEYQEYQQPYYSDQSQQGYAIDPTENFREIAKREVEEQISKLRKQLETLSSITLEVKSDSELFEKRLEKLETTMEDLKMAIIKKVGEYGESISNISEEIRATQDSFSKMVNPIIDSKRNFSQSQNQENKPKQQKQESQSPSNSQTQNSRKDNSGSFEDYLR